MPKGRYDVSGLVEAPPLDFSGVQGRERQVYFDAVRRGLDRDYLPMQQVFGKVIAKTLRAYGRRSSSSQ